MLVALRKLIRATVIERQRNMRGKSGGAHGWCNHPVLESLKLKVRRNCREIPDIWAHQYQISFEENDLVVRDLVLHVIAIRLVDVFSREDTGDKRHEVALEHIMGYDETFVTMFHDSGVVDLFEHTHEIRRCSQDIRRLHRLRKEHSPVSREDSVEECGIKIEQVAGLFDGFKENENKDS